MSNQQSLRFTSKKSKWLSVFLVLVMGVVLIDAIGGLEWGVFMIPGLSNSYIAKVIFAVVISALVGWIYFGTRYIIDHEELKIVYGPFRKRVPLDQIRRVEEVKDILQAPALSFDRLEIHYGTAESIKVSPKNKSLFLKEIGSR
ncbi:PH domain-containing protein [Halobacillus sp. ACCC02827]|uniref:PH domain-containing protein n=1 Tax=unclassified Halobacillus TaxID=2636472 RepID=UPI0002A4F8C2|nr:MULTISPECIES: PH domain-containing protein [unclassified Halobacillus]ELK44691.1 hypothetical protein D479_18209 [Halobacillus sp. BAB-2008]WJE14199.1 PH domain-containing protein [Halobacillus sp. ACCC02827]